VKLGRRRLGGVRRQAIGDTRIKPLIFVDVGCQHREQMLAPDELTLDVGGGVRETINRTAQGNTVARRSTCLCILPLIRCQRPETPLAAGIVIERTAKAVFIEVWP
jgi:hypothetical protein